MLASSTVLKLASKVSIAVICPPHEQCKLSSFSRPSVGPAWNVGKGHVLVRKWKKMDDGERAAGYCRKRSRKDISILTIIIVRNSVLQYDSLIPRFSNKPFLPI